MVDAVSLSGNSYRAASNALEVRSATPAVETRPAASALAALTVPQPVTQVATPSEIAEDIGDLSFLYAPNGQPGISTVPAYAVPSTQATGEARISAERNPTARLAIESTDLNNLLSSFLAPRTPSANPAPSPDVPAETNGAQLARAAQQSVIAQLYAQF
ncbi:hypothetical protein MUO32_07310 [Shinella sp. CPCC 101442]|uniref:hypothetical protein n=1 Tax=Shinella sp. CPCC 101442 TaxID=2932265 RepID=UPI0021523C2D|nr:hypothetical protein [Shinella sp. CPCC 101442]MCR6498832.1 hypothetical protein [Shinella sp. CPCC 101442]